VNRTALLERPHRARSPRLAWPILVVLALQTFVGVAETWFVSFLGTSAIAGVALVFPLFMLMTMMSNGGIGGGVSSAIARAIGAGRTKDAEALALHAIVIAVAFGAVFTIAAWVSGPALFRFMGADGDTLANARLYSNVVFAAAIPGWIANLLASALRGAGNVRVPAMVTAIGAVATVVLSPLLIFGWGFVPGFGVAGAGAALILFNIAAAAWLAIYMRSSRSPLRLRAAHLEWRLFRDILNVGLLSAVGTIVANLTIVLTTGLVGDFGSHAIAGYGLASRLDYLLIPLLFALGTASVTMVGTNIGAGQRSRARKIAWTGTAISSSVTAAVGLVAAFFPEAWIHLFSRAEEVVRTGSTYLMRVAPFYAFAGLGMALYFASQGAGCMTWPIAAGVARLAVVLALGGYWIHVVQGSLAGLFWIVALSQLAFGAINALAMATGLSWKLPSSDPTTALRKMIAAPRRFRLRGTTN
jgi:putative MATE family efflux protein